MHVRPWDLVFLAGFVVYIGIRHTFIQRTSGVEKQARRMDAVEVALLALVALGSLLVPLLYLFSPLLAFADYELPYYAPWCGLIAMVVAIWLFRRSHTDLGKNWSQTLELRTGHQVIRHGVYRRIRHPMYAAILLFDVGQGLLLANWFAGWSALATFMLMYVVRTPREERMLCEHFGDEYRSYMRETGRVLPRIQGRDSR